MEQILYFILFLIFFIGPGLRKLFEGSVSSNNKSQRSREEIKRYLEKMRQIQQQQAQAKQQQQQQNPYLQNKKSEHKNSLAVKRPEQSISVAQSVDMHITQHVSEHLGEATETSIVQEQNTKMGVEKIQELIINNKNYNDLQKAFLLGEVFNKPKALQDI